MTTEKVLDSSSAGSKVLMVSSEADDVEELESWSSSKLLLLAMEDLSEVTKFSTEELETGGGGVHYKKILRNVQIVK